MRRHSFQKKQSARDQPRVLIFRPGYKMNLTKSELAESEQPHEADPQTAATIAAATAAIASNGAAVLAAARLAVETDVVATASGGRPHRVRSEPTGRKRGQPVNPVWDLFTDAPDAQRISHGNTAMCKHCKRNIRHHNKVMSVQTHLRKCKEFLEHLVSGAIDKPDWWDAPGRKAKKLKRSVSSDSGVNHAHSSAAVASVEAARKTLPSALPSAYSSSSASSTSSVVEAVAEAATNEAMAVPVSLSKRQLSTEAACLAAGATARDESLPASMGSMAIPNDRVLTPEEQERQRAIFRLECERLKYEIEARQVQLVYEKALARRKLLDAGVPQDEVDRILPM